LATPTDAIQNILQGNIYLKPNTRGTLALLSQESAQNYTYSVGTLGCYIDILPYDVYDDNNKPKYNIVFKNGNFVEITLTETISGQDVTGTSISKKFNVVADDGTTVLNTYNLGSETLPRTKVVSGDTVYNEQWYYSLTYWAQAGMRLYSNSVPSAWSSWEHPRETWAAYLGNSNNVIMNGASTYTVTESHFIDFLASDESQGTKYPGEHSTTGGGEGTFYAQNDGVPFAHLPTVQPIDFGFTSIYLPTETDMLNISGWLWSDDFTENIKMNYISPFDNILGIALIPIDRSLIKTENTFFKIGNVTNNNIRLDKIKSNQNEITQYIDYPCGSLNIAEYWGNFIDYDASYSIFLPFVGFRSLRTDDILNGSIEVTYHIDLLTGQAVCEIGATKEDNVFHVLYSFPCNIFYNIAFSGANYMSMYNQQLSATSSGINNLVSSIGQIAGGIATQNPLGVIGGAVNLITGQAQAKREYETAKPDIGRGGNSGGNAGIFSQRTPYIIQCLPIGQAPDKYNELLGVPSMIYEALSDLEGYTEIHAINLDSINASSAEKSELISIMTSGFYI